MAWDLSNMPMASSRAQACAVDELRKALDHALRDRGPQPFEFAGKAAEPRLEAAWTQRTMLVYRSIVLLEAPPAGHLGQLTRRVKRRITAQLGTTWKPALGPMNLIWFGRRVEGSTGLDDALSSPSDDPYAPPATDLIADHTDLRRAVTTHWTGLSSLRIQSVFYFDLDTRQHWHARSKDVVFYRWLPELIEHTLDALGSPQSRAPAT